MTQWPWEKGIEKRDSSYTDTLIRTIVSRAGGTFAKPEATAALEICSGAIARAFMTCEVSGAGSAGETLNPACLGMIARELIRRGEYIALIEVVDGLPRLFPSAYTTITGGHDPATWLYQVNLAGPSGMLTVTGAVPERIVHLRYAQDPERPWRGVGPVQAASLAGRLSAETLEALGDEASGPRGSFLPVPDTDGQADTIEALKGDVKTAKGGLLFVESMTETFATGGQRNSPDWKANRFGMEIPDSAVLLQSAVTREIMATCGIPAALVDPKSSAAAREAWRTFLFGTVSPLGKIVQAELRRKLFPGISLGWNEILESDLQGRARAFQSMVGGGMELERAAALSGLLIPGDDSE